MDLYSENYDIDTGFLPLVIFMNKKINHYILANLILLSK